MNNLSLLSNVNPDGNDNLLTGIKTDKANLIDEGHGREFEEQLAGILGNVGMVMQMGTQISIDDADLNPLLNDGTKGMKMSFPDLIGGSRETWIARTSMPSKVLIGGQAMTEGGDFQGNEWIDPFRNLSAITSKDNQSLYLNLLEPSADDLSLQEGGKEFIAQLGTELKSILKETQIGDEDAKNQLSIDGMPEHLVNSNIIQKGNLLIAQDVKNGTRDAVTTENLIRQVGDKFAVFVKDGFSKATIELEPPSMGSLKVDIIVKDNVVRATIAAEHQVVKEVLKANLSSLTDALTHRGFQVSELSVFLGDRSEGFREGYDFTGGMNEWDEHFSDNEFKIDAANYQKRTNDNAIDIFV